MDISESLDHIGNLLVNNKWEHILFQLDKAMMQYPCPSLAPGLVVVALAAVTGVVLVARPHPHLVHLVVGEAGSVVVQRVGVDAPAAAAAAPASGRQGGGALWIAGK